jgi:antitoxin VapB
MAINVNNPEADALTRQFAQMAGVGITDAIVIAMREAINRRSRNETPLETAARLRAKYEVVPGKKTNRPLPRHVFDAMWDDA